MTGRLAAARDDLRDALSPLGEVFGQMPARFTPPVVLLQPDDPWLTVEDDTPFRMGDVHYRVVIIVRPGDNPAQDNAITALAEQAVDAIHDSAHEWTLTQLVAPYDLQLGEAVFLAVRLHVTRKSRITTT